jgi:hypothetical protein
MWPRATSADRSGDLRLSVEIPDLETLLREVIETPTAQERDVQARDAHWYSVRSGRIVPPTTGSTVS